ncbi:MAG TPA: alpha/beta hydrolase [Nocardioides sp.]|uniref:alpha/beta fold hydrolase n=1 Tax=Nocardioides sp. TaxID=35761 RepID=UPI002D1685DE|nr:alpha/beta hydrolase [Nocardioides sp.]HTW16659.1 alpha/beta hydrolase [Nocardioides sp.]
MSTLVRQREGSGPPLVLLHPLGADARFFEPLLEHVEHEAWTADVNPTEARPTLAEVAEGLAGELDAVLDGPAALVGVSLGGLVAQHLAAAHPALVSHLVLADTLVSYPAPMREMWAQRAADVRAHGTESILGATLATWYGADAAPPAELEQVCRQQVLATGPATYARACLALRDADTSTLLDRIQAPTLVLCGDRDAPPFLSGSTLLAERLAPDAGVTWLGGGHHAALLEQPQAAAVAITAHVRTGAC